VASSRTADVKAGALFIALGLFFGIYALRSLDLGSLVEMGPGLFPLFLCGLLVLLGTGILLQAEAVQQRLPKINWPALALVTAAPIAFGLTVRRLGLLPALALSVLLAVIAGRRVGWLRGLLTVAGVTVFCVAVFKWGLDVPFDLINPALMD
jgi:hypothetical protein